MLHPLSVFFFFIILRPPRSTLFPTRRSSDLDERQGDGQLHTQQDGALAHSHAAGSLPDVGIDLPHPDVAVGHHRRNREDRKSTRLNSSHVSISYAVFCLKKKKITKQTIPILH